MNPRIRLIRKTITKITKRTLAIVAAPAAIPPKPKMAAITATIKKIKAHHNISLTSFLGISPFASYKTLYD
jgi:hypothetical protein